MLKTVLHRCLKCLLHQLHLGFIGLEELFNIQRKASEERTWRSLELMMLHWFLTLDADLLHLILLFLREEDCMLNFVWSYLESPKFLPTQLMIALSISGPVIVDDWSDKFSTYKLYAYFQWEWVPKMCEYPISVITGSVYTFQSPIDAAVFWIFLSRIACQTGCL